MAYSIGLFGDSNIRAVGRGKRVRQRRFADPSSAASARFDSRGGPRVTRESGGSREPPRPDPLTCFSFFRRQIKPGQRGLQTIRRFVIACVVLAFGTCLFGQSILVKPYIQPGDDVGAPSTDSKTIVWMTEPKPAQYHVDYGPPGKSVRQGLVEMTPLRVGSEERYFLYSATLPDLPLDQQVQYRVLRNGDLIGENTFATRKSAEQPLRFIVTGDLASGGTGKYAIARQIAQVQPQFVLVCGDIAYERGRISDYLTKFWPVYNDNQPAGQGTTLMQSTPFYVALGNHDAELADLATMPDAFAAFYFFHAPRIAPAIGSWRPFIPGPEEQVKNFEAAAVRAGYPSLCLYSFDNGAAHFLVLDSNAYMPLLSADYREWIRRDLLTSRARWKFVFFHQPGFHAAADHFRQQKMRLLAPLFEEAGVDIVFAGHVHNYQRSKPLRFTPKHAMPELGLDVRGQFALDEKFDGVKQTKPDGVIYVVTGGGGAELYPMMPNHAPGTVMADPDSPTTFNAKFVDDRHTFTVVDLEPHQLAMRQIDDRGLEVDRVAITKP